MAGQTEFLQAIQELERLGETNGNQLSMEEINAYFSDMKLEEKQLDFICNYFESHQIYITNNGVDGAGTILMEYPDMIGEAIYSKITDSAMPSQIQGEDASMLIQEIENVKDLRIVRKGVVQSIHFEQSDNILNYETQEFIKMIKTGMGWEKSKEITLETMKVLDEARKQLHIVFPADKKPKEKKK